MAGKTPAERAKEFLAGVVAHIPEDRRQAALDALTESPEALAAIGQGVLRQDEFSRHKDALASKQTELDTLIERNNSWYAENAPKVARANDILAGGGVINDDDIPLDPATRRPAVTPPQPSLTAQQLAETVAKSEKGAVLFFGVLDELRSKHFQEFGEILNTRPLLEDPQLTQIGLPELYQRTFADKYAAKAKAEQDKLVAAAEQRGREAATAELQQKFAASGSPYPTPHAAAASAVVDTLKQIHTETEGDAAKLAQRGFRNRFDENAAAVEYQQLVAQGVGAGQT